MKNLTHILVLLCFLAGLIAPACGFSWGGKYSVIEICTSQGIESRIVENAPSNENSPENHQMSDDCQFCFQNAHLKAFLVPQTDFQKLVFTTQKQKYALYEAVFLSRVKTPQSLRGPPILV